MNFTQKNKGGRKVRISILVISIILIFMILIANFSRALYHCINANDFSIYGQALYEIAAGNSWNPYLTIRNLHILNDHADPIIYLGALFVKIFGYSAISLITFEWLWFVSLILLFYFLKKFKSPLNPTFLLGLSFLLFSRSLLQGLEFPIHPTTWSMVPGFLLFYFIKKDNIKGVIITAIFICLFREILPFMIVSLSGYYFLNKRFKTFWALLAIGGIYLFIFFYLRPIFLGPTVQYGNSVLKNLFNDHIFYLWGKIKIFKVPYKVLFVYILPVIWIIKIEVRSMKDFIKHPLFAAFLYTAPLFLLHVLASRFHHHHTIPMITPILGIILFSKLPEHILKNKKLMILLLVPAMATSSSRYTRMVKSIFLYDRHCVMNKEKRELSKDLYQYLENIPNDKVILSTAGLIQAILRPNMQLYQLCGTSRVMPNYDYIIIEKNGNGEINPLSVKEAHRIIEECKPYASEIPIDNTYYIVLKGSFTDNCIGQKRIWPMMLFMEKGRKH